MQSMMLFFWNPVFIVYSNTIVLKNPIILFSWICFMRYPCIVYWDSCFMDFRLHSTRKSVNSEMYYTRPNTIRRKGMIPRIVPGWIWPSSPWIRILGLFSIKQRIILSIYPWLPLFSWYSFLLRL